jgi:hypothetical protein
MKKIKLNKKVIAELTSEEQKKLEGGKVGFPTIGTVSGFTYNFYCSNNPDYCQGTTYA